MVCGTASVLSSVEDTELSVSGDDEVAAEAGVV